MRLPRIRLDLSFTIGDETTSAPNGPDTEAQIGTHMDAGYVDTGIGFTTPANTPRWDDE